MAKKKHAGGRPTRYKKEYVEQVKKLVALGAKDEEMANFFGVSTQTFYTWKNKYPEFLDALKKSKVEHDNRVERSLLERASGYTAPEEKQFFDSKTGKVVVHKTVKHYPPDPTSMIFWLKNRQPQRWRDKQDVTHSNDPDNPITINILPVENKKE